MHVTPLHRLSGMICQVLDWELSPAEVLRLVRDDPHPVALLGTWIGGSDVIASSPVRTCAPPGQLSEVLNAPFPVPDFYPKRGVGALFGGGWIGYLGFGPEAWWFGYYDHVLRRDRATGRWTFESLADPDRAGALESRLDELSRRVSASGSRPREFSCGTFRLTPSPDEHRSAVRRAVDYIRRGDIFQANICLRFEADFAGDPLDAFCTAAGRLDPPYAAFLRVPGGAVASMSPELFLRRTGTSVLTRPIKGTRPRPADAATARRQRRALERSAKDRAENVMITDLMRNDLSRVCLPGTVEVPALLHTEPHPGVWHLVSDVHGTLPAGTSDAELVAAAFPPGSVTGAPKVRALEIINELEATSREVYTGAIGYRSPVAGLELNVAIRTFEFAGHRVRLGSGGGITARSDDEEEYRECLTKAAPLIRALDATLSEEPEVPVSLRPRPAAGVFTSLRVTSGSVRDLEAHLARLGDSTCRLFGKPLPSGLGAELTAVLASQPSGRLRITARPCGGPLRVTIEIVAAGATPDAVALHPVTIPGGLGDSKWADRRLLAELAKAHGPDLLIEDSDGDILETDRANVFAVIGGVLRTPPADGRLLPGITRAAVLRLAAADGIPATQAPLSRQCLAKASEVFVTNSVHGIVPVRSLSGTSADWDTGPVTHRLTALLPSGTRYVQKSRRDRARPGARSGTEVVLIDNYDSFTYNLAHLLRRGGCRVEVVRNDEVRAIDVAGFRPGGIVISPGPCAPDDAGISVDVVRLCAPTTPLLGVCLGHQAIAAAYGARVIAAPEPIHGQACPISHDGAGLLSGLPRLFTAARYHSLIVDERSLPPDLIVTARGPGGIPMGLRHVRHPAEGLQFHPESILTAHGGDIIRNFLRATEPAGRL